jgi:hypothetical protein
MPLITTGRSVPSQSPTCDSSACAKRPPSTCMMPSGALRFSITAPRASRR